MLAVSGSAWNSVIVVVIVMGEVETRATMEISVGMDTARKIGVMEIRTSAFRSVWRVHAAFIEGAGRPSVCQDATSATVPS